ncbi:MAG TPA: precorrin-6A reductase [Clostridiaceae bacterium]|nr:precorrin-6A reductase [Clostridiaceae bacterium]
MQNNGPYRSSLETQGQARKERGTVLIVAGTLDGREAVKVLYAAGVPLIVSVATEWAAALLGEMVSDLNIHVGRLDEAGFMDLITTYNVTNVLDCTHPYAVVVSQTLYRATAALNIGYTRYTRPSAVNPELFDHVTAYFAADTKEACQFAQCLLAQRAEEGTVFLTTGSKDLPIYARLLPVRRLIVRVLPVLAAIEQCNRCNIKPDQIIAMQGPFDVAMNKILFSRYRASVIITKDGGAIGGFTEKVRAAAELDIPIIVIERPKEQSERQRERPAEDDLRTILTEIIHAYPSN